MSKYTEDTLILPDDEDCIEELYLDDDNFAIIIFGIIILCILIIIITMLALRYI